MAQGTGVPVSLDIDLVDAGVTVHWLKSCDSEVGLNWNSVVFNRLLKYCGSCLLALRTRGESFVRMFSAHLSSLHFVHCTGKGRSICAASVRMFDDG